MALTVVVRSGDTESPPTITLDAPRIVVGRGEGCDVLLPDPSVSHRHASFRQRGAEYVVVDEGSTNGTFAGQLRLSPQTPRVIRSGDLVRVGRVWLELRVEHVVPTAQPKVVTREIALSLVASALQAEGEADAPRVWVRRGPDEGKSVRLADFDQPYLVGRANNASLSLADEDASRRHVELLRRGSGVRVRDLGSKNGTVLGDQHLERDRETAWPVGTALRIGQNELAVEDPVADALSELERLADEHMREDEDVQPPTGEHGSPPEAASRHSESPGSAEGSGKARAPRRDGPGGGRRKAPAPAWGTTDLLVAILALTVLALSIVGTWWLFGH